MQREILRSTILSRLKSASGEGRAGISLGQIRMWVVPQKGEHDHDYNINQRYFDGLLGETISDLLSRGYIASSVSDGVEDGDPHVFSLTNRGASYVEELAAVSIDR